MFSEGVKYTLIIDICNHCGTTSTLIYVKFRFQPYIYGCYVNVVEFFPRRLIILCGGEVPLIWPAIIKAAEQTEMASNHVSMLYQAFSFPIYIIENPQTLLD